MINPRRVRSCLKCKILDLSLRCSKQVQYHDQNHYFLISQIILNFFFFFKFGRLKSDQDYLCFVKMNFYMYGRRGLIAKLFSNLGVKSHMLKT